MNYKYGSFTDEQVKAAARSMHGEIHKLLLYKDKKVADAIFETDKDFETYFRNLIQRFSGMNYLLGDPPEMISFLSTLCAAYEECQNPNFDYREYRRLIMDAHGYLSDILGEVH